MNETMAVNGLVVANLLTGKNGMFFFLRVLMKGVVQYFYCRE